MTIKELLQICLDAPDKNAKIYLSGEIHNSCLLAKDFKEKDFKTGYNFDDLNTLDLYLIQK